MTGAKALMDEIKRNHYSNVPGAGKAAEAEVTKQVPAAPAEPKKRRKRRAIDAASQNALSFYGSEMFTVKIVGGLALPGYPLEDGEKLAIAKLTPIRVGT